MSDTLLPEHDASLPIGHGIFVGVCGASGAGKDTLIDHARARLCEDERFLFVRRIVTRPADPEAEDHDSMDREAFEAACLEGAFALTWTAHGLRYGLPASVDRHLAAGGVAIANISRAAVEDLSARYRHLTIVHVDVPPDILAERLAARGRESAADIARRIQRSDELPVPDDARTIDNSGSVEAAGDALVAILEAAMRQSPRKARS